jgi:hypothetical protein
MEVAPYVNINATAQTYVYPDSAEIRKNPLANRA